MQPFSFEKLPKDWKWTPIGEIADAVRGVAFPGNETSKEKFENSIACLTTSGVQDEVNWSSRRFIPKSFLSTEKQILKDGDLLVSTANSKELVGKSCLIKKPNLPCTFGAFVTVLRPNTKVDSPLFAYWMRTNEVLRWCFQNSSNTTNISNLRTSELLALEIPLPKPDEQKRIAAILDKADRLRRQRRFAQTLSDSFLQSVFIKMFGDPVSNSMNWETNNIGKYTSLVSSGSTPLGGETVYKKSGVRFIRSQNVLMNDFDFSDIAFIDEETHKSMKRTHVKKDDVLINITGASIGRITVYKEEIIANVNQHVCIIRLKEKTVLPSFLARQLSMPFYQKTVIASQSGATRQAFNFEQIKDFNIIIPPLPLQKKFAEIVQKFERVRRQQREATRQAEHLFQTLLHRAFRGEL